MNIAKKPPTTTAFVILLLLVLGGAFSCDTVTKATDLITSPTPREVYQRDYVDDTLRFSQWQKAFVDAMSDSVSIRLPYMEKGRFSTRTHAVYSYDFSLQKGEVFHFKVQVDTVDTKIFIDLYKKRNDSILDFVKHNEPMQNDLVLPVDEDGEYKVVAQAEMDADTPFVIKAFRKPSYIFPVSGKGNAAVQSFWGATRDGGRRSHEGIDIFAPRGTPVVAATDGRVSRTGNRGLGGKQVWLRVGMLGHSLYYAHLDSIATSAGKRVKRGDTLGFVGNTGNAKTTPPHLHFGIYQRGALNPLPYVYEGAEPRHAIGPSAFDVPFVKVSSPRANLRSSSYLKSRKIGEVHRNDTLMLLGESYDWLHVATQDNQKAFLHKSLVQGVQ